MKIDWNEIIEESKYGASKATFLEIIVNWSLVVAVGLLLAFSIASLL